MNGKKKFNKAIFFTILLIITYVFAITIYFRLDKNHFLTKKNGSTYLKNLTIQGHEINFDKNRDYYEIALEQNETSLLIEAESESNTSTVTIYNNDDLTKHDNVYIYVTNKEKETRKYTIGYTNKSAYEYFNNNIDYCSKTADDYCIKFFNIRKSNKDYFVLFSYDKLTNKGYPNTNIITVNDKEVFKRQIVNAEFRNFNLIDDKLIFTYNSTEEKNKIYIFGFNFNGNIFIDKNIINEELKDLYTYYYKLDKNIITLKTRVTNSTKEYLCKLPNDTIVEARYTMKYKNGKFEKPVMTSSLNNLEYKLILNINC